MPSESDLIERFLIRDTVRSDVEIGIGDDAAVVRVPPGRELVVTTDTLIENVHFLADADPRDLGHKALAVNLSDLAAMGAAPAWTCLSLTLPAASEDWLASFSEGFHDLAGRFEVQLIGGDLTRAPLSITVQALGLTPVAESLRRSGARPGDAVYVTGCLGDAGLALAHLQEGRVLASADRDYVLQRLHRPEPRIAAGLRLRGLANAAIDLSDGLAIDLPRLCRASGCGAVIELENLPLSEALKKAFEGGADWRLPLAAGDDYELLFTIAGADQPALEKRLRDLPCTLTRIGWIESSPGLRYRLRGEPFEFAGAGYDHFAS